VGVLIHLPAPHCGQSSLLVMQTSPRETTVIVAQSDGSGPPPSSVARVPSHIQLQSGLMALAQSALPSEPERSRWGGLCDQRNMYRRAVALTNTTGARNTQS